MTAARATFRLVQVTVTVVPLIAVLAASVEGLLQTIAAANRLAPAAASAEIARATGRPVRIGSIDLSAGRLVARDVHLGTPSGLGRGEFASAKRVALTWLGIAPTQGDGPPIDAITIDGLSAHLERDRSGAWNFADILRRQAGGPGKALVGEIRVRSGSVTLVDSALPGLAQRGPVTARVTDIIGDAVPTPTGGWRWSGRGSAPGLARAVAVTGTFHAGVPGMVMWVSFTDADIAACSAPWLPREIRISRGRAAGRATVTATWAAGRGPNVDVRATVHVSGGDLSWSQFASPITGVSGTIALDNDRIDARLKGSAAATPVRARVALSVTPGLAMLADIDVGSIEPSRVLTFLRIPARIRVPADLVARAPVRVLLVGPLDRLRVDASSDIALRGAANEMGVQRVDGRAAVTVRGAIAAPEITVRASAPSLSTFGHVLSAARVDATYRAGSVVGSYSARLAGGAIAGSAHLDLGNARRYRCSGTARNVDLSRVQWRPLGIRPKQAVAGIASADIAVTGHIGAAPDEAEANVKVAHPRYGERGVDEASAALHWSRDRLHVEPGVVRDGSSVVHVTGVADARDRSLDLVVEGSGIDVARLALTDPQGEHLDASGTLYLQSGRISGSWASPELSASLHGYGLRLGQADIDYASLAVWGNQDAMWVDGHLDRLPASAEFLGTVRRPLSETPMLHLTAQFGQVDIQEVAELAGASVDLTGTASGTLEVDGPLTGPRASLSSLVLVEPWIGDHRIDALTAAARFVPGPNGGTVYVEDAEIWAGGSSVTGSAHYSLDGRFGMSAEARDISLAAFETDLGGYITLGGLLQGQFEVRGLLRDGKVSDLSGMALASATGLTVGDHAVGSAWADVALAGTAITVRTVGDSAPIGLRGPTGLLTIGTATHDTVTGALSASGNLTGASVPAIRQLAEAVAAAWPAAAQAAGAVASVTAPLDGRLGGSYTVTGTLAAPALSAELSGSGFSIYGAPVSVLTGSLSVDRVSATVRQAHAEMTPSGGSTADTAILDASGEMVFGETVRADVTAVNLPIELAHPWLPEDSVARLATGSIDLAQFKVTGAPVSPVITGSIDARDIRWAKRAQGATTPAPNLPDIGAIRLIGLELREGRASVADAAVVLAAPAPGPQPTINNPHELHASANVDFSWTPPYIPSSAQMKLAATLPKQDLDLISRLVPASRIDVVGTVAGTLNYDGTVGDLAERVRNPIGTAAPRIAGELVVQAERLGFEGVKTSLADVGLNVRFLGDRITLAPSATTGAPSGFTVKAASLARSRHPVADARVSLSGELPVTIDTRTDTPLRLTGDMVRIAESPLMPGMHSGYLDARLAASGSPGAPPAPGIALTVTGSLFAPHIAGVVHLRDTLFRPPTDELEESRNDSTPAINPTLDIAFHAGDGVRVSNPLLSANVRTTAGLPVRLTGDMAHPRLDGSLVVDSGTMIFPLARFTIARGSTVGLRYPPFSSTRYTDPALAVILNVTATGRMTAASVTGQARRYTITIEAKGPLNTAAPLSLRTDSDPSAGGDAERRLSVSFRSDPPDLALSSGGMQRRITALLGGQEALESVFRRDAQLTRIVGYQLSDMLSASVMPDFFGKTGLARALGFDEISVDYSQLDSFTLRLTRNVVGPLTLSYWRRLTGASSDAAQQSWELRLGLRLNNRFQLAWSTNDQRTNAYLVQGVMSF